MKNLDRLIQIFNKKYFLLFLVIYFIIGVTSSLKVGISHDEFHEQQNWEYNKTLVHNFLENNLKIINKHPKVKLRIRNKGIFFGKRGYIKFKKPMKSYWNWVSQRNKQEPYFHYLNTPKYIGQHHFKV